MRVTHIAIEQNKFHTHRARAHQRTRSLYVHLGVHLYTSSRRVVDTNMPKDSILMSCAGRRERPFERPCW